MSTLNVKVFKHHKKKQYYNVKIILYHGKKMYEIAGKKPDQ